jgi:hypothetical protein
VSVSSSTLYRFLKANGLMEGIPEAKRDRRRFEADQSNELWQSDVMRGPYVIVRKTKKDPLLIPTLFQPKFSD